MFNLVTVHSDPNMDLNTNLSPAEINMNRVSNIIYKRENPHPFIAIGLIVGMIIFMYLIYVLFIKRCISGIWFGKIGNYPDTIKYKLQHNPFTDKITICSPEHTKIADGELVGDTLWINFKDPICSRRDPRSCEAQEKKIAGVLVSRSQIVWINSGDVWNNVKILN